MNTARKLRRNTDPATSAEAAESIVPHLNDLQAWAVACVRRTPGLTGNELARIHCPEDVRKINRRLGECERLGLLRRGPARPDPVSGRSGATWFVVRRESADQPSLFDPEGE